MENNNVPGQLVELAVDNRTARERTLAHLEKMMRVAVATVGSGMMVACRHLVVDPPPPPPVDPPPPPPQECCENPDQFLMRGCIRANGVWANLDGQWTLHLTLYARDGGPVSFDGLGKTDLTLSGITLKEMETQANRLALVLVLAGDELPSLQLPVTCNREKVPLRLSLDLNEPPAEGRSISVRVVK